MVEKFGRVRRKSVKGNKTDREGKDQKRNKTKQNETNKQKPQVRRLMVGDVGPEQIGRSRIEGTPQCHCKQDEQSLWS